MNIDWKSLGLNPVKVEPRQQELVTPINIFGATSTKGAKLHAPEMVELQNIESIVVETVQGENKCY